MSDLQAKVKRGYIMATVLVVSLGVTILTMLSPVVSTTEDFSIFNTGWNGTSGLAVSVYETGRFVPSFRVESSGTDVTVAELGFEELDLDPTSDAVVVIGPSEAFSAYDGALMGAFVRAGGALLIADDFGSGNSLLEGMGASSRFSGKLVMDLSFEKKPEFPVCYDLRVDDLTRNVSALQLNYPSSVTLGASAAGFAYTSSASWLDANGNGLQDYGEPWGPFPVLARESMGQGTVVLLSDPSVLINGMSDLLSNARLSDNMISYLSSARTSVYFDESHRAFFDPVAITTAFTGSISNLWKGVILFTGAVLALWVVTDFVDRAVAWTARSFRRVASVFGRLFRRRKVEEPVPEEKSVDDLTKEIHDAHPEWREGLIRHALNERRRHGRAQTRK